MAYRTEYLNSTRRKSKYNNTNSCMYDGNRYDSIKEARYAEELDWRKKAGEIKDWDRQVTYDLKVNGKKICGIRPDFRVWDFTGGCEIHEVKSKATMTPQWQVKWKLLEALLPELEPNCTELKVII